MPSGMGVRFRAHAFAFDCSLPRLVDLGEWREPPPTSSAVLGGSSRHAHPRHSPRYESAWEPQQRFEACRGRRPRRPPRFRDGRPPPRVRLRSLLLEELGAALPCAKQAGLAVALQFRARLWVWVKVAALVLLQRRCLPRAWRLLRRAWARLGRRSVEASDAGELQALREGLRGGRLERAVEVGGRTLPAGAEILASEEELAAAAPQRLHWRPGRRRRAAPRPALGEGLKLALLAEAPLLLWGWGQLGLEGASCLLFGLGWDRQALRAVVSQSEMVVTFTAIAWFLHRLISWWRDKRSRGRATITDVLGWESSLKEAQVNALKVIMQVIVWSLYLCASLWAWGIQVGRVLLFPSVTAVVIGWIGREVVANIISGVVIHLTQPFAQGDWVTLENGNIDGWVQDTGTFYTRVMQWDKRPIYVPNFKLMSMNVQNNSRMTHRRIIFELPLRLRDIPKIPQIVQDMQEMINEHEDIDTVQHRLVRWRAIGEYSATIWVSCYTHPTMEGIRLGAYTAVQQSILERCSQVVYKHGAEFASLTDRFAFPGEQVTPKTLESVITEKLFDTFNGGSRESQLESREQVLRQREREVKERERENEAEAEKLAQKAKAVAKAEEQERRRRLAAAAAAAAAAAPVEQAVGAERPQEPPAPPEPPEPPGPPEPRAPEPPDRDAAAWAGAGPEAEGSAAPGVAAPEGAAAAPGAPAAERPGGDPRSPAAAAPTAPTRVEAAGVEGAPAVADLPPHLHDGIAGLEATGVKREVDNTLGAASSGKDDHGATDDDFAADAEQAQVLQDGEVPQSKTAMKKRIPVKEMGD